MYVKCRAKINLILNVLDKRKDGYHNLESIFQTISLYDELYVEKTNKNDIDFFCNVEELNNDENIIIKTYKIMKEKFNCISGAHVKLIKHIPSEAGMGGGSSDCAQFLIVLNKLFNLGLSKNELIDIGKNIGADVPACIAKGTNLGQGIGEILTPIATRAKYYLVIIKPEISFNTKNMFEKLDNKIVGVGVLDDPGRI